METLNQFYVFLAQPDNLLIVALLGVGIILKKIEVVPNKFIPLFILPIGLLAGGLIIKPLSEGLLKGIIYTSLSIYLYESLIKHIYAFIERRLQKLLGTEDADSPKAVDAADKKAEIKLTTDIQEVNRKIDKVNEMIEEKSGKNL